MDDRELNSGKHFPLSVSPPLPSNLCVISQFNPLIWSWGTFRKPTVFSTGGSFPVQDVWTLSAHDEFTGVEYTTHSSCCLESNIYLVQDVRPLSTVSYFSFGRETDKTVHLQFQKNGWPGPGWSLSNQLNWTVAVTTCDMTEDSGKAITAMMMRLYKLMSPLVSQTHRRPMMLLSIVYEEPSASSVRVRIDDGFFFSYWWEVLHQSRVRAVIWLLHQSRVRAVRSDSNSQRPHWASFGGHCFFPLDHCGFFLCESLSKLETGE